MRKSIFDIVSESIDMESETNRIWLKERICYVVIVLLIISFFNS
jgi:hypothetical protein